MASRDYRTASVASLSALETNKVLKNTYLLLSATLGFSAFMAALSMSMGLPFGTYFICLIASMLLGMFVLPRTANSGAGIGVIFLVTGLLGFGLGPIVGMYMATSNGAQLVSTALGGTAVMFLGLSAYAIASRRDFSFMTGFLMVGTLVGLVLFLGNAFLFKLPLLHVGLCAFFIMVSSGFILWQTGQIVRGGETNYIIATYSLFTSFFSIFIYLLQILGFASGDD